MHLLLTGLCCTSSMTPLSLHNDINKNTYLNYHISSAKNFAYLMEFSQIFYEIST